MSGNRKYQSRSLAAIPALSPIVLAIFLISYSALLISPKPEGRGYAHFMAQEQPSPAVDPFYLKMLAKAENELARRDYAQAIKDFEIAAFGLAHDPVRLAKAYVYLGICHYHFRNINRSEDYFRQAVELIGLEGFASISLLESVRPEFKKLAALYGLNLELGPKPEAVRAATGGATHSVNAESERGKPPKEKEELKENPDASRKKEPPTTERRREKEESGKRAAKTAEKAGREGELFRLDQLKEGDLVPLDLVETRPLPIKQVAPVYPPEVRERGFEGTVVVNALVSETGRVLKTEILQEIRGAFELNAAARRAVRQWEFEPAMVKGIRVKVWLPVAIEFRK